MSEYTVKFEVFEGPLDLLLYLIRKEEVDIYEVNLTRLASQFIEYLDVMRMLDLDIAGEFLVMASTLMYIKSRELLPRDLQVAPEEDEDEADPRWELIRQLVEYKKFKDAAAQMQRLELETENTYPRLPGKPAFMQLEEPAPQKLDVSIFDLVNAVNAILKRVNKREDLREIFEDKWTVSEKIEQLIELTDSRPLVSFLDLFTQAESKTEVVCIFLALLELIRMKRLVCVQSDHFGEIEIRLNPNPANTLANPTQRAEPEPAPAETAVETGASS
jgi:segregation and condensation protein A